MTIAPELDPDPTLAALAARTRPPMVLDPVAVLGAAHRHAHRRTAARVVASVAAVAAAATVAVNVSGMRDHAAPAWRSTQPPSTAQVAQTLGEGDLATMSGGIQAVNLPGPAAPPAHSISAAIPGITAEHDLALAGPDGASVVLLTGGPRADGTAGLLVTYADKFGEPIDLGQDMPVWSWGGSTGTSADTAAWAVAEPDATHRLDVALVPADLELPRVVYWTVDDTGTQWQEVPTFDAGNGRLVTAFTTTGAVPDSSGLAFVGHDGQIVEAPCPAHLRCTSADEVPGLEDYLHTFTAAGEEEFRVILQRQSDAEKAARAAKDRLAAADTEAERQAAEDDIQKAQAQLDAITFPGG
ncbi:DUF4169 family protein [Cellulomonas sp. PhB150]|uniref:DUF4169 family protein n=1 Tax=Cellulomonas sp. PhB150 TaxID=2485188 RepID=UPI000F46479F|nr:DUF4169 family protein [Cellulomonas sp. PhB150]ROS31016.1 hypothetical protein EDF34_0667 [Cellulomonas sp. PhB150]